MLRMFILVQPQRIDLTRLKDISIILQQLRVHTTNPIALIVDIPQMLSFHIPRECLLKDTSRESLAIHQHPQRGKHMQLLPLKEKEYE